MANLCIRIDDADLEELRKQADERRVPHTILARMLIVQGLRDVLQARELNISR